MKLHGLSVKLKVDFVYVDNIRRAEILANKHLLGELLISQK